ncbi:Ty3/gypsy retrotransposon protein [Quillaja saponaria]|uniref:Ty3/gypsy retrotransposon protein n=1 Tax=Quillaja saponaria TaxID=32244 RepID=A0AAD7VKA0_QUISA|nr:Ty3/gypsy retrotransposon protein [Quillaja saponaria]
MSSFWKELMKKMGVKLNLSTAYHPQSDGQSEVLNRCLETFLRCMSADKPREWAKWLPLAEFWYNTNFHSAAQTTPYEIVYVQAPPLHLPYIPGDSSNDMVDRSLIAREAALKLLKYHLMRAQDRMKGQVDKKRTDKEFQEGEWVYLKLQPYRQLTMANKKFHKLSYKFYGPYQIVQRVGRAAYKLDLPSSARIHPTFHISQLKKKIGDIQSQVELPEFSEDGIIVLKPTAILDRKFIKKNNQAVIQLLVQWAHTYPEDATWVDYNYFIQQFPDFPVNT